MQAVKAGILILGGTGQATDLANEIAQAVSKKIIYCLAGRTSNPRLPESPLIKIHQGGFKKIGGLTKFLKDHNVEIVIDALHPFAEKMRNEAIQSTKNLNIKCLHLAQNLWTPTPQDQWIILESIEDTPAILKRYGLKKPFVTLGNDGTATFKKSIEASKLKINATARLIEDNEVIKKNDWLRVIKQAPPYSLKSESQFLTDINCDCLITRNGGQKMARNKCHAAAELNLPVIMIEKNNQKLLLFSRQKKDILLDLIGSD